MERSRARLLRVPMALGDVLDRLTILSIKAERIVLPSARANVLQELSLLSLAWQGSGLGEWQQEPETILLRAVNCELWEVEDRLRALEQQADFGPDFVSCARLVYRLNDRRAALKRGVSQRLGSALLEEKLYAAPG